VGARARALESIGAAVESDREGLACLPPTACAACTEGISTARCTRRDARSAPGRRASARPSRFVALAAAHRARTRRAQVLAARDLPGEPVALLGLRPLTAALPEVLERSASSRWATSRASAVSTSPTGSARRAGAHELAHGATSRRCARARPARRSRRRSSSPGGVGAQLERALHLLVDRVLARRERRGRTIRALAVAARARRGRHVARARRLPRGARRPDRMRLALGRAHPRAARAGGDAALSVERFGPPSGDQRPLLSDSTRRRRARLREAVQQARAAAGPDAALRVLAADPDSRVPERRAVLTPYE